MSVPTQRKRAGRPPQKALAQTSSRSTFTVRMRGSVRAALIEASESSGRSISEELEQRIEESFRIDVQIASIFRNRRNYARLAAIMEAMDQAEAVQNPEIKNDDDRECLKTLAAIEVLSRYASFYGRGRGDALRPLFSVEPHNGFVDRVLMQTDPYFAMWHEDPDVGTDDNLEGADVQVRQEPTTVVKVADSPKTKQRNAKCTTS